VEGRTGRLGTNIIQNKCDEYRLGSDLQSSVKIFTFCLQQRSVLGRSIQWWEEVRKNCRLAGNVLSTSSIVVWLYECFYLRFVYSDGNNMAGARINLLWYQNIYFKIIATEARVVIREDTWLLKYPYYRPGQAFRASGGWGYKVVCLSVVHRPPLPVQEISLVLIYVRGWVEPRTITRPEGVIQWKILVTSSWESNPHLSACSAVPQPTAPLRSSI
jgi:hypothetical protein